MEREQQFMMEAIRLGREGMKNNAGGPFGCVVVKGDTIIGRGWNSVTSSNDPTAHAEVVAIRDACRQLQHFQLEGCEIYTSCEPCPMCLGAIYWARPERIYFAASREDAAAAGFDDSMIYDEINAPLSERRIAMISIGKEDAIRLFQYWNEKGDRIAY